MMRGRKLWAALLLAALCLTLCACGQKREGPPADAVSLWYTEGTPLAGTLEALAESYNGQLGDGASPVLLRSFPDEESLAAAFDAARPDLLLCSHERAFALYEAGSLRDAAASLGPRTPDYPALLGRYSPCVGRCFFPLGFDTQLFAANGEGADAAPAGLEALLEQAAARGEETGLPCLTAESFSGLLYSMLLSLGSELHGLRQLDISNPDYVRAYNLLAGAAYTGGLAAFDTPPAALLEAGYLPWAAVRSSSLAASGAGGLSVSPLPRLEAGEVYLAEGIGLAVTAREGRSLRSPAAFLAWLCTPERLARTALDGGLVPPADFAGLEPASPLEAVLLDLAEAGEPHFPMPDADFFQNRDALEAELRAAVALLN